MKKSDNEKLDQILELVVEASSEALDKKFADKKVNIKKYVDHLVEEFHEKQQQAINKAKETAHKVDEHVHKKPWAYIGGAAVGGFILGLLCRRH